jgi:hypothetical protein
VPCRENRDGDVVDRGRRREGAPAAAFSSSRRSPSPPCLPPPPAVAAAEQGKEFLGHSRVWGAADRGYIGGALGFGSAATAGTDAIGVDGTRGATWTRGSMRPE